MSGAHIVNPSFWARHAKPASTESGAPKLEAFGFLPGAPIGGPEHFGIVKQVTADAKPSFLRTESTPEAPIDQ